MRCDYEANNGPCNAVATWEAVSPYCITYACDRHRSKMRGDWQPTRQDDDTDAKERHEHYHDEGLFELPYTHGE